jgi:hypothetical protein
MTIAGTRAIRGFRMHYVPLPDTRDWVGTYMPERNLLRFGSRVSSTGVTAYFGDEDPDGLAWTYQVSYATFK